MACYVSSHEFGFCPGSLIRSSTFVLRPHLSWALSQGAFNCVAPAHLGVYVGEGDQLGAPLTL